MKLIIENILKIEANEVDLIVNW